MDRLFLNGHVIRNDMAQMFSISESSTKQTDLSKITFIVVGDSMHILQNCSSYSIVILTWILVKGFSNVYLISQLCMVFYYELNNFVVSVPDNIHLRSPVQISDIIAIRKAISWSVYNNHTRTILQLFFCLLLPLASHVHAMR